MVFLVFQQTLDVLIAISNFLEDLVTKEIILILIETTGSYVLIYSRHRSDVITIKAHNTKTEMEKLESQLGCRYSVSLDLSYFCPIEMLLIDPMHNLFLVRQSILRETYGLVEVFSYPVPYPNRSYPQEHLSHQGLADCQYPLIQGTSSLQNSR